jgi:hypothetical protein
LRSILSGPLERANSSPFATAQKIPKRRPDNYRDAACFESDCQLFFIIAATIKADLKLSNVISH